MNSFSSVVKNKVLSALNDCSMLSNTKKIIVGFSGGADSVCLLYVLHTLKNEINVDVEAVHINHGIRGSEAKRDENFAVDFCNKLNIPVKIESFDCISEAKINKESLEECGRRVRYSVFDSLCDSFTKVATAHNANDNAETVLFNLSRGSSVKGVCGIPFVRGNIIRPLIFCSREEIEGFCKENGLCFVTDSSNLHDEYSRNKIRHGVIPVLEEVNSSAVFNIANFCDSAKDITDYISLEAQKTLDNALICRETYDLEKLKNLHKAVLSEVIVKAYSSFSENSLDRNKLKLIIDLISSSGRCQLYGDERVEVVKNKLRFYRQQSNADVNEICFNGCGDYIFGSFSLNVSCFNECLKNINKNILDNLIDCDRINGNLFFRCRREGDSFTLYKRNVTKTLKKLFNEISIPVELRDTIPVLCDDDGIVWIYSVGVCARCHITESSSNIICVRGENNGRR